MLYYNLIFVKKFDNTIDWFYNGRRQCFNMVVRIKKFSFYFFLSFVFIVFLIGCNFKENTEKLRDFPDIVQENYIHYIYKNELLYLKANVAKMSYFEKKNIMDCIKINAEVYNSKKEIVTQFNSDSGYIDLNNNILQFKDNVVIRKLDKETSVYASEINLNYKTNKLYSDKEIVIKKDDGSMMKASSIAADLNKMKIDFNNIDLLYKYREEK